MTTFNKLRVQGFGSILEETEYNLNSPGLNIIKGDIGAGKTTLIDALYWVLFGVKTKKKSTVEPWPHIITKDYKGTKVEVDIIVDKEPYTVIRCSEYKSKLFGRAGKNRLILLHRGKEDTSIKKNSLKLEVARLIGYSPELFRSTIFFGQGVDKFMQEDGPTKKKVLEEAFLVTYITKAQDRAKKEYTKVMLELKDLELVVEPLRVGLESYKRELSSEKINLKEKKEKKEKSITDLKVLIKNLDKKLSRLPEVKASVDKLKKHSKSINTQIQVLEPDVTIEKQELRILEDDILRLQVKLKGITNQLHKHNENGGKCVTCNRKLKNLDEILAGLGKDRKKINAEMGILTGSKLNLENTIASRKIDYNNRVTSLREELKLLDKELNQQEKDLSKLLSYTHVIKHSMESLAELKLEKITSRVKPLKEKIQSIEDSIKKVEPNLVEAKDKLKDYEWLIKDPLSNSGLKAFIYDTMLTKLNTHLAKYNQLLGFKVAISINMASANKDVIVTITKNKDEIPASDLSGGQKQLANLVIGLCFHTIQTEENPTNLLILDECFEGLNEKGIQLVADLLIGLKHTKSIHLVTHRNFNPSNAKLITVECNSQGVSTIQAN